MKNGMKSFIVLGTIVLSAVSSLAFAAGKGERGGPLGKVYYTAVNIWYEKPREIPTTNYHRGTIIPVNTKATITEYNTKEVTFKTENNVEYTLVYVARHSIKPMSDLFNQYFSEKEIALDRFTEEEQKYIKKGDVTSGMSKEAVLAAFGYPPAHATASIDANQWKYWENRFTNFLVTFNNNTVTDIGDEML
jgi:hypothetical protein